MPKISIALCTYNGAKYVDEQLQSYSRQTRLPDELIVCDDCSSDETVRIVRQFAASAPFPVRLCVNEKGLGFIKNFEKAISLTSGDLIFLSDQDDVWNADKLEIFEREFDARREVGMVFCNADLVSERLEPYHIETWGWLHFSPAVRHAFEHGKALEKLMNQNYCPGFTMAFRSEYKNLILPIPADVPWLLHDYWIALLVASTAKITPLGTPLVKYRRHSQQQVGANSAFSDHNLPLPERLTEKSDYHKTIEKLKALRERLELRKDEYDVRHALEQTGEYLRHVQTRVKLQNGHYDQIPNSLRELFLLRYHRYATGFRSMTKDLFLLCLNLKNRRKDRNEN